MAPFKRMSFISALLCSHISLYAQEIIHVAEGTDLHLAAGTTLTLKGLVLVPSATFTLNGTTVQNTATVTHPTNNPYPGSVYLFTPNTPVFNGTIQFNYQEANLNGIPEAALTVNIHNGSNWQATGTALNDAASNYVRTSSMNTVLNEIALAGVSAPLPLVWGRLSAIRKGREVVIGWTTLSENSVDFFSVERSDNMGGSWYTLVARLPAGNTASSRQYEVTDPDYSEDQTWYRIRQTDLDGRSTLSATAIVAAEMSRLQPVAFPNPVTDKFFIKTANGAAILQVRLYNSVGQQIKTWKSQPSGYEISHLPKGLYHVEVSLGNGSDAHLTISKTK